jgi:hypothetical protein
MAPTRFLRSTVSALSLATLAIAASGCSQSAAPSGPAIGSFAATPSSISLGASTLLAWSVTGADSLSIDKGVGVVTGTSISVTPAATTTYRLTAINSVGTTTADATVTVTVAPPAYLTYSTPSAVYVGGAAIANNVPSSTGGPVVSYGVAPALPLGLGLDTVTGIISGTPLELSPLTVYTVTATNSGGSTTVSLRITVTASAAPVITAQPASQAVVPPATATFTVTATGSGALGYQWQKNGTVINGATDASYTTPETASTDTGSVFKVVVSDAFGNSVTSTGATLLVQGFKATGAMTTARESHAATRLANGKVLVTGGYSGTATLRSAEIYDPATGIFTATAGLMNTARQGHSAILLQDGRVLIAGGSSGTVILASAEIFDPTTGAFTATSAMPAARTRFASALLSNGKVLVAGGIGLSGLVEAPLASAALFDPAAGGSFASTSPLGTARESPSSVLLQDGKALVLGGYSGAAYLASAETYDLLTGGFTSTGGMTFATWNGTATVLTNGKVLVAGGQEGFNTIGTTNLYDPTARSFATTGAMGTPRAFQTASLLSNGKVLVAGGSSGASVLGSAEFYDPAAATFAAATSQDMVTPRYKQTATPLTDDRVLVVGGIGPTVPLASAEVFTPIP